MILPGYNEIMEIFPLICDQCGESIDTVDDGWVEWLVHHKENKAKGLRLVHHGKCYYNKEKDWLSADNHLTAFHGIDGLLTLLSLRTRYNLPQDEIDVMVLRLNVPGYDQAFRLISEAIAEDVYQPSQGELYPSVSDINEILKWHSAYNS